VSDKKNKNKGNGHDDNNISEFPKSLKERDTLRRKKEKAEKEAKKSKEPQEPIFNLPDVVKWLCLIMIAVHVVRQFLPEGLDGQIFYSLAVVPVRYFGDMNFGWEAIVSLVTHIFIHGGWLHLLMNMAMLLAFGAGLEKEIGHKKTLLIFFVSAVLGAIAHILFLPDSFRPMIGASGGVSGMFGAILITMQMNGAMGQGYRKLMPFILLWVGISLFFGIFGMSGTGGHGIAWTTHIGGFFAGLLLFKPILKLRI